MVEGRCYDNSNGTNDMSLREALQHVRGTRDTLQSLLFPNCSILSFDYRCVLGRNGKQGGGDAALLLRYSKSGGGLNLRLRDARYNS